jgi:acetylornithine deacetylase/succinyl-diaminopimelate desuccinylase
MNEVLDAARIKARLERLVGFDTQNPPGCEAEAASYIGAELAAMGCRAETTELGDGRVNMIGRFDNGPGPVFAFNTHIDVVPAGEGWTSDPFQLREADGRLYGRGACDAKGPLAAMLEAMQMLVAVRDQWSGSLVGAFVADEEVASIGARKYAASAPKIDFCVVGEPTSCTTVAAHKGSMRPIVHLRGVTAHSGTPDLGVNAILNAGPLFDEVMAEHARIKTRHHDLVGSPSLTVTRIAGGHADNVVPNLCEVLLDRRLIPGEDEDAVKAEITALVARAAVRAGSAIEVVDFKPTTGGATETARDHAVVLAAQRACLKHHGCATSITGFQGGCDLVHLRGIGAQGVVLGPGSLEVAHKPDEYVPEAELAMAALIYSDIALDLLSAP